MKISRLLDPRFVGSFWKRGVGEIWQEGRLARSCSAQASQCKAEPGVTPHQLSPTHDWVSIRELFEARVHLGHREGSLDPRMTPYLWGSRLGHLIIDLDITAPCLRRALDVTLAIAQRKGIILFVSASPSITFDVEEAAKRVGEYAHTRPWRLGMFTNSTMMYGAVTRLPDLVISLTGTHPALIESAKMAIPTIAVVDSDCDPSLVTYPVPGNDDSPSAIKLYLSLFTRAIQEGKASPLAQDSP